MGRGMDRALLDYIVAHVDEDTPRLAYADWLDENDRPEHAEFVRVQVERAGLPAWDPAQVRLRLREEALLKQFGEAWLAEMPRVEGARWEGFRRGVVAEVSFASYEAMRKSAQACRALAPVEAVTVRWPRRRDGRGEVEPIAELRELSLTGHPAREEEVRWLADSPQLSTLRALTARGLWPEGMGRLVASPHLVALKALRIPSNNLGNAGIVALVGASLPALEELDLSGRGVSERYNDDPIVRSPGMESLAEWEGLARVRSLTLSGNEFGAAGLRTLLRSPHVTGLKQLSVRGGRLNGGAMGAFRDARPELQLDALDVGENVLGASGADYLAGARCLSELKTLRLDRCEIPAAAARLMAKQAPFIDTLRVLDVGHNHFGTIALSGLLGRKPPALHTLRLRDNDLFDKGAALLAGSPGSDGLLEVDLSLNNLRAAAARALGASPYLRGLLVLRLGDNPIPGPDTAALAASPLGKRLTVLELPGLPLNGPDDPIPF
ncbi:MAG: TIGR02996 domain-containing protein [Planctomycetes bacterium]|nr:TIGR02996 domain-containing protein [Planctomycetota bacterium]